MTRLRAMQWGALAAGVSFAATVFIVLALQGQGLAGTRASASTQGAAAGGGAGGGSASPGHGAPSLPVISVPQLPTSLTSAAGGAGSGEDNLRITNDVRVYQKVKDAVVNITSSRMMTARVSSGNDLFDRMMPDALPTRQVQASSLGSGFVIHPSGYIITNEHVIEEGTDVQCVFCNGDKLAAQVIATDDEHDLAVLKVVPLPGHPLTAITLGSSEDLMVGEPVYAIGNPLGYAGTMTRGIISAVDRTLNVSPTKTYTGVIQTDASINPGNSGGPLLNAYGQVIGVNTAIRADAQGIGFAISVSNMRDLLPAFLNPEALNRAQIGFTLEEIRKVAPPANVTAEVVIKSVQPGSAADKNGLKPGDVVLSVGGVKPANVVDALVSLATSKPGDNLGIQVARGLGVESKTLDFVLPVTKAPLPPVEEIMLTKLGIKGQTVTPSLATKLSLSVKQGVYIDTVTPDSPAAKCGLQTGDVLFQLGRYYVNTVEDVATLLKTVTQPVEARVGIVRGNARGAGVVSLK